MSTDFFKTTFVSFYFNLMDSVPVDVGRGLGSWEDSLGVDLSWGSIGEWGWSSSVGELRGSSDGKSWLGNGNGLGNVSVLDVVG
jgi:hypothetical protein